MLGAQQRFSASLGSLGGTSGSNIAGGPYPTAPIGPLRLSYSDPSQMPILRSQSPSPQNNHGRNSRNPSPPQNHPRNRNPSPPQNIPRHPSPLNGPNPNPKRLSSRPVPNPATAFPSFTAGKNFSSETQLQHVINWQTVTSQNMFEEPPTFQSLLIFLLPSVPSPAVNTFVKRVINTSDHITHLQNCWTLLKRNDREEMISFGLPERVGDMRFEIYRMWIVVRLAWRIVQALKNAKEGTRIAEIAEWVMYVIETNRKVSPEKFDPIPLQTFACALTYPHPSMSLNSKIRDTITPLQREERDKMALEFFELGFPPNSNANLFLPSTVYAKAHHARLLRKFGQVQEAEATEQSIRAWWVRSGNAMMPKSRFTDLVCAEGEAPYDNIVLKSLDGFFERRSENGSTSAEEGDSSSGRDSGVDVGPVHERKPMMKPASPSPQPPQVPPKQAPMASLPSLQPYTPQMQMQLPPRTSSQLPPLQTYTSQFQSTVTPPKSSPQNAFPPRMQTGSMPTLNNSKPYTPQLSYEYNVSSDSLNSDHGHSKSKVRQSIGAKLGFRRKERNAV